MIPLEFSTTLLWFPDGNQPGLDDFVQEDQQARPEIYCFRHGGVIGAVEAFPGYARPEQHSAWLLTQDGIIHDEQWIQDEYARVCGD